MPIGNVITLGIGTPGGISPFITLGLDIGSGPVPPVLPPTTGKVGLGVVFTMAQNIAYILPSQKCSIFTTAVAPTIQQSNDITFATFAVVSLTGGTGTLSGEYVRCTSGEIIAILKAG